MVSQQTHQFYLHRGHLLPCPIFENLQARHAWSGLSTLDTDYVELEDIDFTLVDDIAGVWINLPPRGVLGFYEGKAIQNPDKPRGIIAGAVFCYITALTKELNMTPAWVQRRKLQFSGIIPDIIFDNYIFHRCHQILLRTKWAEL